MFGEKKYKISVSEDWIDPEDTLIDSISSHPDLEVPIQGRIFKAVFWSAGILSLIITAFVFDLSVRKNGYFADIAFQNKSVSFSVPPPRGIIFDRLGRPLVKNEPVFDLLIISKEARDRANDSNVAQVADVLGKNKDEFSSFISENISNASVFFAALNLDKNQVLKIKAINSKGFYIVPNTKRNYIDGLQFSQVLGYVGRVNRNELGVDDYYYPTDIIGRLGIEAQYEEYLRGEHGKIFFQYEGDALSEDSVIGDSLVLNIDYDIQKRLFNELFNVLKDSNRSRAAAVVQHPQTGEILAMVSFPAYDNNLFISGLSDAQFRNLFQSSSRPLFNRVISGLYNPGSTIKPFMGLMTLEENILSPSDTIQDCVGLTVVNPYNPDDIYTFSNWRVEYGRFNLKRAIANSCNVYFYIVGGGYGSIKGLGIERIANYLKSAFVDSKLGIDLPGEVKGFVPTPNWKLDARGEGWYQGDTYNISIGQGDLLVTPLWLNSYISAIANGGTLYKPLVAKQVLDSGRNIINSFEPEALGYLNFREEVMREVRDAMAETVISGTAKLLGGLPVKAGAKTGTAEVVKGGSVNSLMTAFAPFDNPEISISVLIENAPTNEGSAIKATYGFMKWYFGEYQDLDKGEQN